MEIVELYRGTNIKGGKRLLQGDYNNITWWSDNYETLLYYYEGSAIRMLISINEDIKQDYIISENNKSENYTF